MEIETWLALASGVVKEFRALMPEGIGVEWDVGDGDCLELSAKTSERTRVTVWLVSSYVEARRTDRRSVRHHIDATVATAGMAPDEYGRLACRDALRRALAETEP